MNDYRTYSANKASGNQSYSAESISNRSLSAMINTLLSLGLVLSALILPLYLKNFQLTYTVAWISCIISAVIIFISVKKRFHAILIIFLLGLTVGFFESPIIPAAIFAAITSIGAGSALICSLKGKRALLTLLIPPFVYAMSLALTIDPITSLYSLIPVLPIAAMGLTSRAGVSRTVSVVLSAMAEVLLVLCGIAIGIYSVYGSLNMTVVKDAFEYFKGGFVYYAELGMKTLSASEITPALRKELYATANDFVNLSFGMLGALCTVTSFLSHGIHLGLMSAYGIKRSHTDKNASITISVYAALTFVVAYILSFATDSSNMMSFTAAVGMNICIILIPGLVYVGFDILSVLPKKLGLLGLILWGGVIMLILTSSSSFLFIFALIGSAYIIIRNIDAWAKDHYSKGDKK